MRNGHTAVQFQAVSSVEMEDISFIIMDLYYGFFLDICLKVSKTDFKSRLLLLLKGYDCTGANKKS